MLTQAQTEQDWNCAAELLGKVASYLHSIDEPLWASEQISRQGLMRSYQLAELYFAVNSFQRVYGCVFLQDADPLFWPEVRAENSLFIHKLALDPDYIGKGQGAQLLEYITQLASARARKWVRLDCDDRQSLHRFYQAQGFALVDFKQMQGFRVARYQKAVISCL